ncbi:MAG: methanogenesis marker 17 protein [archaeon]|nr:methanogenesis marker 17 protein [archaeon]
MEVKVEGADDFANTSYGKICQDTFRDLGVRTSIDHTYLYISPKEPVFLISVKIGRVASPIKVRDVTQPEKDKLKITEEKFAPKLLAMLWDKFGESVQQIGRLEIGLKLDEQEAEALKDLIVYEPREDLIARILDGIDRILPEGARVRYSIPSPRRITIIASENPIGEDWKKKAEEIVRAGEDDV